MPLKCEPWQCDVLNKRMELCRRVYNRLLEQKLDRLGRLEADPIYSAANEIIREIYRHQTGGGLKNIKTGFMKKFYSDSKTGDYFMKKFYNSSDAQTILKGSRQITSGMLKEAGISEYAFISDAVAMSKTYKENISSAMAIYSIAKPLWASFDAYLTGEGESVHIKKEGTLNSLATDGKSGIRVMDAAGHTTRKLDRGGYRNAYILCGTRDQKCLNLPIIVDPDDIYLQESLEKEFKIVRILRKRMRGSYRYFVQLSLEGAPVVKRDADGNRLHPVCDGAIGVYIDTRALVIATPEETHTIDLTFDTGLDEQIAEVTRYMERSRRRSNPANYEADGSVRRVSESLNWVYSKNYMKAKDRLADLKRIAAEKRRAHAYTIANEVLSYGSRITVNDYSYKGARAKAGRSIEHNTPAQILTIIDRKLAAEGLPPMTRKKLRVDHSLPDFRERCARELLENS